MTSSRRQLSRRRLEWFALSLASGPLALFFYVLFEWLFFVTKPSMLSGVSPSNQLALIAATAFPLLSLLLLLQSFFSFSALLLPYRFRGIAVIPAAAVLGMLIIVLFDNFTYVLFGFGIVNTGEYLRLLYVVGALAAVMGAARLLFHLVEVGVFRGERLVWSVLVATALICGLTPLAEWHMRKSTLAAMPFEPAPAAQQPVAPRSAAPGQSGLVPVGSDARLPPNVLFLSADGLGVDRLSIYGYDRQTTPFLEELRDEWRLFENAFSNTGHTHGSILSMLTGKPPTMTRVVYPPQMLRGRDAHEHLPAVLKRHGYVTVQLGMRHFADAQDAGAVGAFDFSNYRWEAGAGPALHERSASGEEEAPRTDPHLVLFREAIRDRIASRLLHVFAGKQMVDHHAHVVQKKEIPYWNDRKRIEAAREFIQQLPTPWFMQIHLIDTHCCERRPRNRVFQPVVGPDYDGARFDGEIRDADGDFRSVISTLEEAGLLDETIVVITSDHTPDWSTIERIPLLIRFPNAEHAGAVSANAQLIDLPVTVLDYAGLPIPSWMEGDSLIRPLDPSRPIYGIWRVVASEADSQGLRQLSQFGPPFYGVVSSTLVTGDRSFELNLPRGQVREGIVPGHTDPVPMRMTAAEARELLVRALDAGGFGVGQTAGQER